MNPIGKAILSFVAGGLLALNSSACDFRERGPGGGVSERPPNSLRVDEQSALPEGRAVSKMEIPAIANAIRRSCVLEQLYVADLPGERSGSPPAQEEDSSLFPAHLKPIGFRVAKAGRGNWMHGPRIVSITLERKLCECQVHRLYYSPGAPEIPGVRKEQPKELRVLETIACSVRAKE